MRLLWPKHVVGNMTYFGLVLGFWIAMFGVFFLCGGGEFKAIDKVSDVEDVPVES